MSSLQSSNRLLYIYMLCNITCVLACIRYGELNKIPLFKKKKVQKYYHDNVEIKDERYYGHNVLQLFTVNAFDNPQPIHK